MPILMIKCPTTGKAVSTGVAIDAKSFQNPTNQFINNTVGCPACGQRHIWSKSDVLPLEPEPS